MAKYTTQELKAMIQAKKALRSSKKIRKRLKKQLFILKHPFLAAILYQEKNIKMIARTFCECCLIFYVVIEVFVFWILQIEDDYQLNSGKKRK